MLLGLIELLLILLFIVSPGLFFTVLPILLALQ